MGSILTIIAEGLKLIFLGLSEYFEGQKRARLAQEKFEVDEAKARDIFAVCIERLRSSAKKESDQAQNSEDKIDEIINGGKK